MQAAVREVWAAELSSPPTAPPSASIDVEAGLESSALLTALSMEPCQMPLELVELGAGDAGDEGDRAAEERERERPVRFVCVSDTHGKHEKLTHLPYGDVLVHTGDLTSFGEVKQLESFRRWFESQPHPHKVVIAGNHDISLDSELCSKRKGHGDVYGAESQAAAAAALTSDEFLFLRDEAAVVAGYRLYGSAYQPEFCDWAFQLERGKPPLWDKWRAIPGDTEVLLTHGPPACFRDTTHRHERAGCVDLLHEVQTRVKPLVHIFGHIHESNGSSFDGTTVFVNASTCDLRYRASNPVLVFDLPRKPAAAVAETAAVTETETVAVSETETETLPAVVPG